MVIEKVVWWRKKAEARMVPFGAFVVGRSRGAVRLGSASDWSLELKFSDQVTTRW